MASSIAKPAFKYDFGPGHLKKVDPVDMPLDRFYMRVAFGIVLALHLLVLLVKPTWFFPQPIIDMDESMAVDVDFMPNLSMDAPQENALPTAKKSEDVAVPSNLLPQLPKKFEIEEQQKPKEDIVAEEKDKKPLGDEPKKEEPKQDQENVQKKDESPNKVTLDDLAKRLAVEKLKRENKVDMQMKAQKDAIAKLKDQLVTKDAATNPSSAGSVLGSMKARTYADLLRAAVKRNLYLPKTFEYDQAKLVAQVSVIINAKGELMDLKLAKTSGNEAYDQATMAAIQGSVPLPPPPSEIVGQVITLNLSK